MRTIIVLALSSLLCGCQGVKKVSRTDIELDLPDGKRFRLRNPKENVIDELTIDTHTGKVRIRGYRSTASEAAIQAAVAEAKSRDELLHRVVELTGKLADRGAQAYGLPTGYKMVPSNDPSSPQLAYPDPK